MLQAVLFSQIHRSKTEENDLPMNLQWKCFGCFHVRTAVLIIGLWHLIVHLLGFLLFISARYLMPDYCSASFYGVRDQSTVIRSDSLLISSVPSSESIFLTNTSNNLRTWSCVSLFSLLATLFLIRGIMKNEYLFILPFLLIQVFDILFDFFIIAVDVFLASNAEEFFRQLQTPPFKRFLIRFGSNNRKLFMLIYIVVSFSIKTYLMRIVYFHYKSLIHLKRNYLKKPVLLTMQNNSNPMSAKSLDAATNPM